jgi:dihydrofolate synthase/folylpolyglutamate synthase
VSDPPARAVDARAWLSGLEHFGIKLGLANIGAICGALGSPERRFRSLHIGGTNGKGSVAAMVDAALRAAGCRVGRYTSPHLIRLEERFTVAGEPVGAEALDSAIQVVRAAVDTARRTDAPDLRPTFFEVTTAAAFELFARADVDIAVLEVGLGGRFDATNVVTPLATAITSIAFDHEQHLGHTLAAIAFEKAGIVKAGVPVVIGDLPGEARAVVERACRERGATLHDAAAECAVRRVRVEGRTVVEMTTARRGYPPVTLALRGDHQARNAAVAVRLLELADERGIAVPAEAVTAGLASARWPARLDLVDAGAGREVLVDGAHNPAGAAALADYIRAEWREGLPVVFGAMRDKDIAGMLAALAPVARPFIATTAPGTRSASVDELAAVARALGIDDLLACAEVGDALAAGWVRARRIAAAGSLYLAGRVLSLVGRQQ